MSKKKKINENKNILVIINFVILAVYCLSLLFLYLWALMTSFKNSLDLVNNIMGVPRAKYGWHPENYIKAFEAFSLPVTGRNSRVYFPEMFLNSMLYSVGCAIVITLSHFVVAYMCARYKFALNRVIYTIVILVMIIPIVGGLPAEIKMVRRLGLYDSILGQYFLKMSFLGVYFLIFYGVVKGLGNEYAEAASVDGAGHITIMYRIYIPLLFSVILGVFILYFIDFWGDYMTPLYYLPSYPVVGYALNVLQDAAAHQTGVTKPIILAAAMMSCIPVLILFIIFRDKMMGNLTFGGLKG